jgi:hypothetical protein
MPEIQDYIDSYRRRARASRQAIQLRTEKASEIALRCAEKLVEEFGAERVFLFGSLAEGRFRATSDIDLVAEGLAPAVYFKASAQLSRLAGEFEVDLIPFETYKYKAEVLEKGRLLYESHRSASIAATDRRSAERA